MIQKNLSTKQKQTHTGFETKLAVIKGKMLEVKTDWEVEIGIYYILPLLYTESIGNSSLLYSTRKCGKRV